MIWMKIILLTSLRRRVTKETHFFLIFHLGGFLTENIKVIRNDEYQFPFTRFEKNPDCYLCTSMNMDHSTNKIYIGYFSFYFYY